MRKSNFTYRSHSLKSLLSVSWLIGIMSVMDFLNPVLAQDSFDNTSRYTALEQDYNLTAQPFLGNTILDELYKMTTSWAASCP